MSMSSIWSKWVIFGENGKICILFGDQNDVIGKNFVLGRKYFFLKTVSKIISVRFINITLKMALMGSIWPK